MDSLEVIQRKNKELHNVIHAAPEKRRQELLKGQLLKRGLIKNDKKVKK